FQNVASSRWYVGLLEIASGKRIDYLKQPDLQFAEASISNDGKWMVFAAHRNFRQYTVYTAPFDPERPPPSSEWIEIHRSGEVDPNAAWSPDGSLLYFSSERDGYNCLWAQRMDRVNKRPQGDLFAVQHFHVPSQVMVTPSFGSPISLGP